MSRAFSSSVTCEHYQSEDIIMRHIVRYTLLMLCLSALLCVVPAHAQPAPRWLADPELLTNPKTIGPSGDLRVPDRISDLLLEDPAHGWATASSGIFRFENGAWRHAQGASGTTSYNAIDGDARRGIWVAGSETERVPPYRSHPLLLRSDPAGWQPAGDVAQIVGTLADVAVSLPGAWAVGSRPSDLENERRPLLLGFDGQQWHDQTPADWKYGAFFSVAAVGSNEAWAGGVLGRSGGEGAEALRLAIAHYQNGAWAEAPLPDVQLSVNQALMLDNLRMVSQNEGWAVATLSSYATPIPTCPHSYLLHYQNGAWSLATPDAGRWIIGLGLLPGSSRGWISYGACDAPGQTAPAQRARFDAGQIAPDTAGAQLAPTVYALLDDTTQLGAAGGSFMRYTDAGLTTDRVAGAGAGERFFPETGHTIGGEFRADYETHGLEMGDSGISARESLALFGYPVSQPFDEVNPENGERYTVQYFERARFELHPENADPYRVLLGRIGFTSLLRQRAGLEPRIPNPEQGGLGAGCDRFPETGYDLCAPFHDFWVRSGGLPVYGFPIVNARDEQNPTDGKSYLTQWYERERLEFHPELRGTPYEELLGLLGAEDLRLRGYLQ
jgi:hypothetical protein